MFKIAICDDETIFAAKMEKIIDQYMKSKEISYEISIFNSGKDFMQIGVGIMKYRAVFLDINMNEVNGLRVAEWIRQYSEDIFLVFVTAYIDYSLDGYKFNAIRFLLKDKNLFSESIQECMDTIFDRMNYVISKKDIKFNEGRRKIALNRILFIESYLHKLIFHVMEDQECAYTLYETLNNIELEYKLYQFVRIHQSYLVNMRHIVNVKRYEAILSNGMHLVIPKVRYKHVEDVFIAYKGEL